MQFATLLALAVAVVAVPVEEASALGSPKPYNVVSVPEDAGSFTVAPVLNASAGPLPQEAESLSVAPELVPSASVSEAAGSLSDVPELVPSAAVSEEAGSPTGAPAFGPSDVPVAGANPGSIGSLAGSQGLEQILESFILGATKGLSQLGLNSTGSNGEYAPVFKYFEKVGASLAKKLENQSAAAPAIISDTATTGTVGSDSVDAASPSASA